MDQRRRCRRAGVGDGGAAGADRHRAWQPGGDGARLGPPHRRAPGPGDRVAGPAVEHPLRQARRQRSPVGRDHRARARPLLRRPEVGLVGRTDGCRPDHEHRHHHHGRVVAQPPVRQLRHRRRHCRAQPPARPRHRRVEPRGVLHLRHRPGHPASRGRQRRGPGHDVGVRRLGAGHGRLCGPAGGAVRRVLPHRW